MYLGSNGNFRPGREREAGGGKAEGEEMRLGDERMGGITRGNFE